MTNTGSWNSERRSRPPPTQWWKTVTVGNNPIGVAIAPNGRVAYVTN